MRLQYNYGFYENSRNQLNLFAILKRLGFTQENKHDIFYIQIK